MTELVINGKPISQLSDDELIQHYNTLHVVIEILKCYSDTDILLRDVIEEELIRRGYKIHVRRVERELIRNGYKIRVRDVVEVVKDDG